MIFECTVTVIRVEQSHTTCNEDETIIQKYTRQCGRSENTAVYFIRSRRDHRLYIKSMGEMHTLLMLTLMLMLSDSDVEHPQKQGSKMRFTPANETNIRTSPTVFQAHQSKSSCGFGFQNLKSNQEKKEKKNQPVNCYNRKNGFNLYLY